MRELTFGFSPCSRSHTTGSATRSPSSSRPITSSTATGGRPPFSVSSLRLPDRMPSSAISASRRFSAMRAPPLTEKARAISRLPTLVCDDWMKSRICSFVGKPPSAGWSLPLPARVPRAESE